MNTQTGDREPKPEPDFSPDSKTPAEPEISEQVAPKTSAEPETVELETAVRSESSSPSTDPDIPVPRKPLTWIHTPVVIFVGLVFSLVGLLAIWLVDADESMGLFWVVLPLQAFGQFCMLWVISTVRATKNMGRDFGLIIKPIHTIWVFAGGGLLLGLGWLANSIRTALGLEGGNPQEVLDMAEMVRGTATEVAAFISLAVLGPFMEELLFRGLTLRTALVKGMSPFLAVVISAAIFMAAHLVDFSLISLDGLVTLMVLFLLGLFLGFITIRTGTIGPAIFTHSGFNLLSLIALFWLQIE